MNTPQQQQGKPTGRLSTALTGTGVSRELSPFEKFRSQLNTIRKDVAAFVGDKKVDSFIRICLNAAQYNPDVLTANRRTLMLACLEAAQDGLMPDGSEAVFNVYKTKQTVDGREVYVNVVQYMPMAYGLIQLIYQAGATYVDAAAVFEKDEFDFERGDNPRIVHKPFDGDEEPGKVVAAYCVVKYPGLETKREVMFRRDIEKVRGKSKAGSGLMWKDFYDQGAIKSVIHRIKKQLPQSERLNKALASDNRAAGLAEIAEVPADSTGIDLGKLLEGSLDAGTLDAGGAAAGAGATSGNVVEGSSTRVDESGAAPGKEPAAKDEKDKPEPPKTGDAGTAELKAKFLGQMEGATMQDVLDIVMEDVRFYKWDEADLKELTEKFKVRQTALAAT